MAKTISMTAEGAFRVPAVMRSMQWGIINGIPAGSHWELSKQEADEFGQVWAEVIALYAPVEFMERGSVVGAAVSVSVMVLFTRLLADSQIATMVHANALREQEGLNDMPQPSGTVNFGLNGQ